MLGRSADSSTTLERRPVEVGIRLVLARWAKRIYSPRKFAALDLRSRELKGSQRAAKDLGVAIRERSISGETRVSPEANAVEEFVLSRCLAWVGLRHGSSSIRDS